MNAVQQRSSSLPHGLSYITPLQTGLGVFISYFALKLHEWYQEPGSLSEKFSVAIAKSSAKPNDPETLAKLIVKIGECPAARQLWEEANTKGKINLLIDSSLFARPSETLPGVRTVLLARIASFDEKLGAILTQTANLDKLKDLDILTQEAKKGDINQIDYTKKALAIGYDAAKAAYLAADPCVQEGIWPLEARVHHDHFGGQDPAWETFEKRWAEFLEDPKQESYRQKWIGYWEKTIKPSYCEKHPEQQECGGKS